MTVKEMLEQIQRLARDSNPIGVQLLEVTEEDLEMYLPEELYDRYKAASPQGKERFLACLAEELKETFEMGSDYGFKKLLQDTIDDLETDGHLEDLFGALEDKTKEGEQDNGEAISY